MADKDRRHLRDAQNEPALYDEDYAEELGAETAIDRREIPVDRDDTETHGGGIGFLALALSIIAFFFLPVVMGAAGIIVGIIARRQGAKALGSWAIGLGIVAIVFMVLFAPFF